MGFEGKDGRILTDKAIRIGRNFMPRISVSKSTEVSSSILPSTILDTLQQFNKQLIRLSGLIYTLGNLTMHLTFHWNRQRPFPRTTILWRIIF